MLAQSGKGLMVAGADLRLGAINSSSLAGTGLCTTPPSAPYLRSSLRIHHHDCGLAAGPPFISLRCRVFPAPHLVPRLSGGTPIRMRDGKNPPSLATERAWYLFNPVAPMPPSGLCSLCVCA